MVKQEDMASRASRAAQGDPALAAPEARGSAAWTPGPWTNGTPRHQTRCVWSPTGRLIAEVCARLGADAERAKADARLIASAPELYEALAFFVGMTAARPDIYALMGPTEREAISKAEAALAKAEGR